MTPRRTSPADRGTASTPIRVVVVTMDSHLASAAERAAGGLHRALPGLHLAVHAAAEWGEDPAALQRCLDDIAAGDIIVVSMLFMEDHFLPVLPALKARRDHCDAMVCAMSAGEVTKLTRMGRFDMSAPASGAMAFLKRLRPKPAAPKADGGKGSTSSTAGAQQMRTLRMLPRILRFVPGTAQDVRAYFLTLQYWLAGSQDNLVQMVRFLVDRYADGARSALRGRVPAQAPVDYPEIGVYHPRLAGKGAAGRLARTLDALPDGATRGTRGTVGLLLLRSYLLAGNTDHYDGVIDALEAAGLRVIPVFATGLDQRPAIDAFLRHADGRTRIDALVSLTGFSLVGGPAYNDAAAAEEVLASLDVPYLAAQPLEFQTLDQWGASPRGLMPVEATIMVALPELDGATGSMVFGGRASAAHVACTGCAQACRFESDPSGKDMHRCVERAATLAARVGRLADLRRRERAQRHVAIVLFNFPPNAGAVGTAAFLGVFESLHNTLAAMKREGYAVDLPPDVDTLRTRLVEGNASRLGAPANVHHRIPVNDHVRREPHLREIEQQWGPAPGKQLTDGAHLFVMGERFGNVFVGLQPAFGFEGDPMRLLFEHGFAPTHAFSAFYRWLREDFEADAVLHFGTHGALEFMPGKQTGLSARCWPDRLIGDLPNVYLYSSNNPSEGTLAKRRSAATLVSYLTPPITRAGLHAELASLRDGLSRYRSLEPEARAERAALVGALQAQAAALALADAAPAWPEDADAQVTRVSVALHEVETTLIPHGLHVVGRVPSEAARVDLLLACAEALHGTAPDRSRVEALVRHGLAANEPPARNEAEAAEAARWAALAAMDHDLTGSHEMDGLLRALDGRYLRPAPGGDLLRTPAVLPTGRNLHGFDPFRLPSAWAVRDGAAQAERLLAKYRETGEPLPESIAMVLWGTDNLKSEGAPIGQALALIGAQPRFDSYGRLAGATLVPLEQLGRARIDVVVTLSGIFRDLLPLQIRLLAEAAFLAASADEPLALNPIRRHALAYQAEHGCDLETAALRVWGNAEGAYGSNVNHLIDNSRWDDADELAETWSRRKGFAYGRAGKAVQRPALLQSVLADVQLAYQNLDSVELGVTNVDTYFDTLGGVSRAVRRARVASGVAAEAAAVPVFIGDQTRDGLGGGAVRTLSEQVALETRTRLLNPKWYEGLLAHGYEGVRQIEVSVANTMGWSATTGQVAPWIYERVSATFILEPEMRERMAALNPVASARMANRLLEAYERQYWQPAPDVIDALRRAGDELEDRLEGVFHQAAA
jgi:magnesium chelatase subunit H